VRVCIFGLWHLGCVTSACLASRGHEVIGLDLAQVVINNLSAGKAPIFEPGLDELISRELIQENLRFTSNASEAVSSADVVWVTFDTPVDYEDNADTEYVIDKVKEILPLVKKKTVILISSQLPVGSVAHLEEYYKNTFLISDVSFAVSPENLRLGKSLDVFLNPDRIVVGYRKSETKIKLEALLFPITNKIEWMSVESAEMTKHAINAFLATSVTFANEIAALCEEVGADAKEVERGLKTENRIGSKAYLAPGGPFAGGTLARDIEFLKKISTSVGLKIPLINSVRISNEEHKKWVRRKLEEHFNGLVNVPITIWGLTYKVDTDTLRRSLSVELCEWLIQKGAKVNVYDPIVKDIPPQWKENVILFNDPIESIKLSKALIVITEWAELSSISKKIKETVQDNFLLIDPNRLLLKGHNFTIEEKIVYKAVGGFLDKKEK